MLKKKSKSKGEGKIWLSKMSNPKNKEYNLLRRLKFKSLVWKETEKVREIWEIIKKLLLKTSKMQIKKEK